jgi:hypothetical protein
MAPSFIRGGVEREQLGIFMQRHRNSVGYRDAENDHHAIVWNGKDAIDCSDGMVVDLTKIPFQPVIVLASVQGAVT